MYIPSPYAEARRDALHRLIQEHPLGLLVHQGPAGLDANHLPFLLAPGEAGQADRLLAHVARANPVWRELADGAEVLVVFRGAQGYVSPNWYPGKAQTHRRVPTWNYEVVHAHGRLQWRDDERFVRGLLARLTRQQEASQARPWKMGEAPSDYLAELMGHIVGLELHISRLEGKRKLNQHHDEADREGAIRGLEAAGQTALARAMREAGD